MSKDKIIESVIEFELLNGRKAYSVLEFCKKYDIDEKEFYGYFNSLEAVNEAVPLMVFLKAKTRFTADEQINSYSSKEKMLALFFTLFEEFLDKRSYFQYKYLNFKSSIAQLSDWNPFLKELDAITAEILEEARSNGEIQERSLVDSHTHKVYKIVFAYLFRVWLNDDSEEYSNTDAAIEKSINLSFDMLEKTSFDSLLDFGKFALKTKIF